MRGEDRRNEIIADRYTSTKISDKLKPGFSAGLASEDDSMSTSISSMIKLFTRLRVGDDCEAHSTLFKICTTTPKLLRKSRGTLSYQAVTKLNFPGIPKTGNWMERMRSRGMRRSHWTPFRRHQQLYIGCSKGKF
jgi:hypothetical protein